MSELMSQKQLAEKYGENSSMISVAMAAAGVKSVAKTRKYQAMLYREEEAVTALSALYLRRKMDHLRKADEWQKASDRIWGKFHAK